MTKKNGVEISENMVVFELDGEIMGSAEDREIIMNNVFREIRDGKALVVMDFSKVDWINPSGLGILMAALTTLRGAGGDMVLACPNDRVKRPIEMTGINQILKLYKTVKEAIENLQLR